MTGQIPSPTPFKMVDGKITEIKIGTEIINTPPFPFEKFGEITKDLMTFREAKEECDTLKKAYLIMQSKADDAKKNFEDARERRGAIQKQLDEKLKTTSTEAPEEEPPEDQEETPPDTENNKPEIIILPPPDHPHTDTETPKEDTHGMTEMEKLIQQRQNEMDAAIRELNSTPAQIPVIITPPTQHEPDAPEQDKKNDGTFFLGEVVVDKWINANKKNIIDVLKEKDQFTLEDMKSAVFNAGVPERQTEEVAKELIKIIEKDHLVDPVTIEGTADKIRDKVMRSLPEEFNNTQLKAAIRAQGVEERDIDGIANELIKKKPTEAKPGLFDGIRKKVMPKKGKK